MILVTGAVGNIGRELVNRLTAARVPFRVLVRKPEKFQAPAPGIEVAAGYFGAPDSLPPALEGISKLFLLSGVHPEMVALQCQMIAAAKRAGVRHIVKLSGIGASSKSAVSLTRWHGEIEEVLEASGVPFTQLRPNSFAQNLLPSARQIAETGELSAPMGRGSVSLIDARDIARVAAAVLSGEVHEGRRYTLTGPEALDYNAVADKLGAVIGKTVRYIDADPGDAKAAMLRSRMPEWWADLLLELFAALRNDEGSEVTGSVAKITGAAPIGFTQFVEDHRASFMPPA